MKKKFRDHICWLMLLVMVMLCAGCGKAGTANVEVGETSTESTNVKTDETTAEDENPKADFPIVLEDGKLTIESIFQSSIPNPDKDFEDAVDIASIELVNQSQDYLKKADIAIALEDGTKLVFQVCDIPAGKTVWAFDMSNTTIAAEHPYKEVQCDAEFDETYSGWEGQFLVSSEGVMTEITNLNDQEQTDIKVRFHCVMEDIYFGGISYEYSIDKLAAQESAVLEVIECYFGDSEAVQITY